MESAARRDAAPPGNGENGSYNKWSNKNIITVTGVQPVIYDANWSVVAKENRATPAYAEPPRSMVGTGLLIVKPHAPNGVRCAESWKKYESMGRVAGYLLFHTTA